MKACDAVKTQDNGRGNGRRTGRAAAGLVSGLFEGFRAAPMILLTAIILVSPAQAQPPTTPNCDIGRELPTIPELTSDKKGKELKAVLMLSDEDRSMWVRKPGSSTDGRCLQQRLRYLTGWKVADWNAADPPSSSPPGGDAIPGPTFRARIGDLIQISFRNQVDTKNFPKTLDRGDCDVATGTLQVPVDPEKPDGAKKTVNVKVYPRNNGMPNCVHGSSTTNVHFHGTHTTPGTTGDNVLIGIRPALRVSIEGESQPQIQPSDAVVKENFAKIFGDCDKTGSPTKWEQLPPLWRADQERLLKLYDATAPYRGQKASLPPELHLWPKNEKDIKEGDWPQYNVGAFPFCFRLPDHATAEPKVNMGQAPGTHWYHAHVHGSTALNVANGLAGAFIIEGPYDDKLRDFYKGAPGGLEEKVLVIQQLSTSLGLLSATRFGPPFLSVNGRRQPVITMRPNQVQMWRIVNGAYRSFVQFRNFTSVTKDVREPVEWRQTAQDGVQFAPDNYEKVGKVNAQFNMAGGNRVDLLVKAPSTAGSYSLTVWESTSDSPTAAAVSGTRVREVTLLTVKVEGTAIEPPMGFIDKESFPEFPDFLKDIPADDPAKKRSVVYDTQLAPTAKGSPLRGDLTGGDPVLPEHTIDGKLFNPKVISQSMVLNSVEEWTAVNKAVGIAHPFHIHINPFQVVEVFDPNSAEASDKNNKECYADPTKPETWKACHALQPPFVWWDVRAIPAARDTDLLDPAVECAQDKSSEGKYRCSDPRGNACKKVEVDVGGTKIIKNQCTVKIPGYFKMRSRFVDFPGIFVQHCHILAHEDVGMMQFVEVCPAGGPCPTRTVPPAHQ
jgi:FtsP/CotA-like multicopper oxidase with cupredoxin domain